MPMNIRLAALSAVLALAACGGEAREERTPLPVEETVFRDYVAAPGKAEDRVNAAADAHREALQQQLRESEGAPPQE